MAFDFTQNSYKSLKKILSERTSPVVAWVGAGLSAPAGLPSWHQLLTHLITSLKSKLKFINPDERLKSLEKTLQEEYHKNNYWICFQLLEQLLGETTYQAEIRDLLDTGHHKQIPQSYSLLWKIGIQGIITLNLDQFATRSFSEFRPGDVVDLFVGEQSKNLASVLQRNRPFIGNIHGIIENSSTWIFTHDKLNKLLADDGYKQFINSCLLTRTIFFIGVSADDIAVQKHLEIIKNAGISGINHFWLTSRKDQKTDGWSEKFNIRTIFYNSIDNDHSELIECLNELSKSEVPKEEIIKEPIIFSGYSYENESELLSPDELVIRPLEYIRKSLNKHALSILEKPDSDSYRKYNEFSQEYDEPIDRAWYVSEKPPKNRILDYQIIRLISQGSFGDVYEALDPTGINVALKLLRRDVRRNPSMLQAFRRGVRSMQILKTRNINGMVGFIDASEIPALVTMEWIDGPNLQEAVETKIINDWNSIILVARNLSQIIYQAHTLPEGVLHRDIRPPNIMLKDYWTNGGVIDVVVMDFDLSWHINSLEKSISAKPLGFMAPEQMHRRPKESTRSALVDSFGLGMTLYFMITNEIPVPDQQKHKDWEKNLNTKIKSKIFKSWKSLSHRISRIILGSTQDQQNMRWDFAKIVTELDKLYLVVNGETQNLPIDYYAEEVSSHAETMLNYEWEESKSQAVYQSNGLTLSISGEAQNKQIKMAMTWMQTGEENWKTLPKTNAQIRDRAEPILKKYGWDFIQNDISLRYFKIVAYKSIDDKFSASNLALGVDNLVQALAPRS